MDPGRVGDLTRDRVLLQVDHHHFRGMRQIKPVRRGIDGENIPTPFAADRNFFQEFVRPVPRAHRILKPESAQHRE